MANYALVSLSLKLSFIQCNWGFDIAHLKAMMMGYKSFMIEVGLYSNTISYVYKRHSMLVTNNTWFKNIWELVSYYNVSLNFDEDYQLKPIRQGNKSLMSKFLRYKDFGIDDVVSLNIMRMHKKVIHVSDIVLSDGNTIKPEMFLDLPGHSCIYKFPHQCPTPADLSIWKMALRKISSEFHILTVPLQEYISPPHDLPRWLLRDDGMILHNMIMREDKEYHKIYTPTSNPFSCRTRSRQHFISNRVAMGMSDFHTYASITHVQQGHILLHSTTPVYIPSSSVSGFEQTIMHFTNQSLWASLDYNGDGSWILGGMLAQSLIIIHDGSYMKEISPDICSAATMIYCLIARYWCKYTWTKHSASSGSYRGEILGMIMTQLILNAATSSYKDCIPPVVMYCDNNGVVSHGNTTLRSLPTNQPQAEFLCVFKHLVLIQPFPVKLKYVQSHTD
jgi:hypothetical protein